ncbi:MAG: phosphoglucomutase/phosphomannomutase family protein [Clostridiaceae bacterium]|nr:phosphoglucomutase/phosphomannomutase family protein [Clostridiaceae bacterium]
MSVQAKEVKFGTGGWRAVIGDVFTRRNMQRLCAALARKMNDEGVGKRGIVIGYDRRFLSDLAAGWAAEVFAGEGVPVRMISREAPTPLIMYTVKTLGVHYGMAVTASHNPAIYNGVKVFEYGGRDAVETTTKDIERRIGLLDSTEAPKIIPLEQAYDRGLVLNINPFNQYIDSIVSQIDIGAIRDAELHIALDPMFGVSRTSLQTILLTARCEVDTIHDRHDTLFGGRLPSPDSTTLQALREFVLENGCDMGVATDGDADRIGIIDDRGTFIHPNQLMVMLYYYLLKYKGWRGPVVRNIATTMVLDRVAASFGEECYEVPVGFKYISSKMAETDALIGGESSGGLTVRGHISGKDGIYAAALLVEMRAVVGKPLSAISEELYELFGRMYTVEKSYGFSPELRADIQEQLMVRRELPEFPLPIVKVSYADGCKVYFENGWLSARFSGTEPLIRVFCEMPTEAEADELAELMRSFLNLSQ